MCELSVANYAAVVFVLDIETSCFCLELRMLATLTIEREFKAVTRNTAGAKWMLTYGE
jgi:hypothetical protein